MPAGNGREIHKSIAADRLEFGRSLAVTYSPFMTKTAPIKTKHFIFGLPKLLLDQRQIF